MQSAPFLIVGGTRGIGLAIARALAERGEEIVVAARDPSALPDDLRSRTLRLDAVDGEVESEGLPERLQGLVYCPGTIRLAPLQRLKDSDFEADFRVNVLGAVRCIRAALPALKRAPEPASVLLFSTVAVRQGLPFHASVAAAKGGVEGLTRSLAAELAPAIRVNAIAPSLTDTTLAAPLLADDRKRDDAGRRHPLRRYGRPSDIVALALPLLEPDGWVSGQVLGVDGGLSALRVA